MKQFLIIIPYLVGIAVAIIIFTDCTMTGPIQRELTEEQKKIVGLWNNDNQEHRRFLKNKVLSEFSVIPPSQKISTWEVNNSILCIIETIKQTCKPFIILENNNLMIIDGKERWYRK